MADEDLRAYQRAAAAGDPEAQARYQRALCRKNGHRWSHYKGGDHLCQVCGEASAGDTRELGAQTMYESVPADVMARALERFRQGLDPFGDDGQQDAGEQDEGAPPAVDPFAEDPEFFDLGGL